MVAARQAGARCQLDACMLHAQCSRAACQTRCRCGRGEPSPGADVAQVSPIPVQMWKGRGEPHIMLYCRPCREPCVWHRGALRTARRTRASQIGLAGPARSTAAVASHTAGWSPRHPLLRSGRRAVSALGRVAWCCNLFGWCCNLLGWVATCCTVLHRRPQVRARTSRRCAVRIMPHAAERRAQHAE
jgi:hypothetical protein